MSPLAAVCNRHRAIVPAGGRCARCAAEEAAHGARRRSANNRRLGRNTAHWRRVSRLRLQLAGYLCEIGRPGCTVTATTVDLIGGGDHSRARLDQTRAACRHCHGAEDGGRRRV